MTIKTGRRCKWDEIAVGEVFAQEGCWGIFCKVSERNVKLLADDWDFMRRSSARNGKSVNAMTFFGKQGMYKLPKSFQRCFIQWK